MLLSDLQSKDLISVISGDNLGKIVDVEIDEDGIRTVKKVKVIGRDGEYEEIEEIDEKGNRTFRKAKILKKAEGDYEEIEEIQEKY